MSAADLNDNLADDVRLAHCGVMCCTAMVEIGHSREDIHAVLTLLEVIERRLADRRDQSSALVGELLAQVPRGKRVLVE